MVREEHWQNATEYKDYLRTLNDSPHINLCSSLSERFVATNQLVSLGIMKTSDTWDMFRNSVTRTLRVGRATICHKSLAPPMIAAPIRFAFLLSS